MQYLNKTMSFAMGGKDAADFAKRWEETFKPTTCGNPNIPHAKPCGRVPGHEDLCACGCDAYGMRCTDTPDVGAGI